MSDVMFDLETLGTTADAVIMSVGAVKFDLRSGKIEDDAFYRSISIESNFDLRRRVSEDTLIWWMKQGAAAQTVFHEAKETLSVVLEELSDWIGNKKSLVWSNGADFDIPMLAHAFTQCQIEIPWEFYNARCVRTYKKLPGAENIKIEQIGVKHNALADAYHQAVLVSIIHNTLFPNVTKKIQGARA
jgi:DNA polymerase III epsilon subunit-like protein